MEYDTPFGYHSDCFLQKKPDYQSRCDTGDSSVNSPFSRFMGNFLLMVNKTSNPVKLFL